MVTMDTSRRRGSIILYTVEGVTPERTANSLYLMFRWRQRFWNLSTTASLIPMPLTSRTWYLLLRRRVYALAYIPDRCYTVPGVI